MSLFTYYDYLDQEDVLRQLKEEEGWITADPDYLEWLDQMEQMNQEYMIEHDLEER